MSEARPLIPESNAKDTRKWRKAKSLAIFMFAVVVYGGMYLLVRTDQNARLMQVLLIWFPISVTVAIMAINVIRFRGQARRFMRECNEAHAALGRGELQRAHDTFWSWAETTKLPRVSTLCRHNLGWTLMRQGELAQAIAVATDNDERNPGALTVMGLFSTSSVDLALYHALRGDAAMGQQWMIKTAQRTGLPSLPTVSAMTAFARAVLDCRAGRPDEAARNLDERWAEYEALLTGDVLRPLRIVRAFALAAGGPRDAGLAEAMLASARPAYPGEYDFLGVEWPEMAAFLVSQGLSRKVAADTVESN